MSEQEKETHQCSVRRSEKEGAGYAMRQPIKVEPHIDAAGLRAYVAELRAQAGVAEKHYAERAATLEGVADQIEERFLR